MSERDSAPWDAWRNAEAEVERLKEQLSASYGVTEVWQRETLAARAEHEKAEAALAAAQAVADKSGARAEGGNLTRRIEHLGRALAAEREQSERLVKAAWRVIGWYRRAEHEMHPLEPGMETLIAGLEKAAGQCPADIAMRVHLEGPA